MLILDRTMSEKLQNLFKKAQDLSNGEIKIEIVPSQSLSPNSNAQLVGNVIKVADNVEIGNDSLSSYFEYVVAHELAHSILGSTEFPIVKLPNNLANTPVEEAVRYVHNLVEHNSVVKILKDYGFSFEEAARKFEQIVGTDDLRDVDDPVDRVLIGMMLSEYVLYYPLNTDWIENIKIKMPKTFEIIKEVTAMVKSIDTDSPLSQRLCQVSLINLFDRLTQVSPPLIELVILQPVICQDMLDKPANQYLKIISAEVLGELKVRIAWAKDNTIIDSYKCANTKEQLIKKAKLESMIKELLLKEFLRIQNTRVTVINQ